MADGLVNCPGCDGRGDCANCDGADPDCDWCGGTGECIDCDGAQKITKAQYRDLTGDDYDG